MRYRIIFLVIFCVCTFSSGCLREEFQTPYGFILAKFPDLEIMASAETQSSPGARYISIRHGKRPECLLGTIEPFMPMAPADYFQRLNDETALSGKRPFLENDAIVSRIGKVFYSQVSAFDDETGKYGPAVAGAFQVREELWIAWIRSKCNNLEDIELARKIVMSIRVSDL